MKLCPKNALDPEQRNISGLGVGGWLGLELLKFHSLKEFDVSCNNISGEIPRNLPPSVEYINLAANKFEGNIPPTLPWLHSLKYLNFSHNILSGIIGDVFINLESLVVITMQLYALKFWSDTLVYILLLASSIKITLLNYEAKLCT